MLSEGVSRMLIRIVMVAALLISNPFCMAADEEKSQQQKSAGEKKKQQPALVTPPLKQFIPTEKIEADSAISLPVDI